MVIIYKYINLDIPTTVAHNDDWVSLVETYVVQPRLSLYSVLMYDFVCVFVFVSVSVFVFFMTPFSWGQQLAHRLDCIC